MQLSIGQLARGAGLVIRYKLDGHVSLLGLVKVKDYFLYVRQRLEIGANLVPDDLVNRSATLVMDGLDENLVRGIRPGGDKDCHWVVQLGIKWLAPGPSGRLPFTGDHTQ